MNKKTVILAGSGHAHLEVVKAFTQKEILAHQFFLISPQKYTYYSGLIPRMISGGIDLSELTIPSAEYAISKGLTFIQDSVQSIDSLSNTVHLASGKKIGFDILSLNVGGTPPTLPTQSPDQTIHLRPFDEFLKKWPEVEKICTTSEKPRFVIVGGGAAAVEVATALRLKLNKMQIDKGEIHLVTQSSRLCQSYSKWTSSSIKKSLLELNIQIHLNETVNEILSHHIQLKNNQPLNFDLIFIVTPTQPSEIMKDPISLNLQNTSSIFSVGDGTTLMHHPELPRSGVIAVHQGRHLALSLKNLLADQPLTEFNIPASQLNILITGDQSAHLVWGSIFFRSRWAYQLKKWIDKRYVKQFASRPKNRFRRWFS